MARKERRWNMEVRQRYCLWIVTRLDVFETERFNMLRIMCKYVFGTEKAIRISDLFTDISTCCGCIRPKPSNIPAVAENEQGHIEKGVSCTMADRAEKSKRYIAYHTKYIGGHIIIRLSKYRRMIICGMAENTA